MQLHDLREVKQSEELAETLELEAEVALACAGDARRPRRQRATSLYGSGPL
jgi:hypothetical protein